MADEVMEEGSSPAQSPLVSVSFQRNVHRKEKYLEGEPKALGITEIGLSMFQISCVSAFMSEGLTHGSTDVPLIVASAVVIIAGALAIAAQKLHLPTLRACFGMQIVACGTSIFSMICTLLKMDQMPYYCWRYHPYASNGTNPAEMCQSLEKTHSHLFAELVVINVALIAISVTLGAYCYKVINCCSPAPKMPVITVQVPPVQQ